MKEVKNEKNVRFEDGYFIRDFESNTVICPNGSTLRQKSTRKNGYRRYMSKYACSHCENIQKCYLGKNGHKEVDFPDGARVVKCRNWGNSLIAKEGNEKL